MSVALHDIKRFDANRWQLTTTPPAVEPMLARARLNYPNSEFNQAAWLRAVAIVRKTRIGWRLDNQMTRGSHA